jgi:hypothetical protein
MVYPKIRHISSVDNFRDTHPTSAFSGQYTDITNRSKIHQHRKTLRQAAPLNHIPPKLQKRLVPRTPPATYKQLFSTKRPDSIMEYHSTPFLQPAKVQIPYFGEGFQGPVKPGLRRKPETVPLVLPRTRSSCRNSRIRPPWSTNDFKQDM